MCERLDWRQFEWPRILHVPTAICYLYEVSGLAVGTVESSRLVTQNSFVETSTAVHW
jgi:hypothetical protein